MAHFVDSKTFQGPGHKLSSSGEGEFKGVHGGEGKTDYKENKTTKGGHFVEDKSYQGPGHNLGTTPASASSNKPK